MRKARRTPRRRGAGLGSAPSAHTHDAALSAARTRGALDTADAAIRRGDCSQAWFSITHAAENLGALAAHMDSGAARHFRGLRPPADDGWAMLKTRLASTMERAGVCIRRR